ncbi:MAG: DUF2703 domain-containing protein [Methanomicrobiales archaeon]
MTRTLEIEWEHTPDLPEVPVITSDTKKSFCGLLRELRPAFKQEDIALKFTSRLVTGTEGVQNRVTLNGRSLWDIIVEVSEEQRLCDGRRCEMRTPIRFLTIVRGDIQFQCVPDLVLRKVLLRACGII